MRLRPFGVERWLASHEFVAKYNLGESGMRPLTLEELLDLTEGREAVSELMGTPLGYGDSRGMEELREEVGRFCGGMPGDRVLLTVGAIEANYLIFQALVEPGDTVVTEFPLYQQLYEVAGGLGARVRHLVLRPESGYLPDPDELVRLVDDRTRLIVINHPHNPTGSVLDRARLQAICDVADRCGAYLLADEAYRGLGGGEGKTASACQLYERAIAVGSMSKAFGLAGLRIGWVVGPGDVVDRCVRYRDYTSICVSVLGERLALLALRHSDRILARHNRIARENARAVDGWVSNHSDLLEYVPPAGGVVCFPRYKVPVSSRRLCEMLMAEKEVLLVPGECFGVEGRFRLGFGGEGDVLREALARVGGFLKALTERGVDR